MRVHGSHAYRKMDATRDPSVILPRLNSTNTLLNLLYIFYFWHWQNINEYGTTEPMITIKFKLFFLNTYQPLTMIEQMNKNVDWKHVHIWSRQWLKKKCHYNTLLFCHVHFSDVSEISGMAGNQSCNSWGCYFINKSLKYMKPDQRQQKRHKKSWWPIRLQRQLSAYFHYCFFLVMPRQIVF